MIPPSDWLSDTFGEMKADEDVIREPRDDYPGLTDHEKDKLRQTQVFRNEIVQILGTYAGFKLIRKFDGTKGWVKEISSSGKKSFEVPGISETTESFLKKWLGVPYVFGGCSFTGIDCSAFIQNYFLHVHGRLLPKNSRDQRKMTVAVTEFQDFDLIFCHPRSDVASHHVVLFYQEKFWHSRRVGGVVVQTREEFLRDFEIEDHRRVEGF